MVCTGVPSDSLNGASQDSRSPVHPFTGSLVNGPQQYKLPAQYSHLTVPMALAVELAPLTNTHSFPHLLAAWLMNSIQHSMCSISSLWPKSENFTRSFPQRFLADWVQGGRLAWKSLMHLRFTIFRKHSNCVCFLAWLSNAWSLCFCESKVSCEPSVPCH